MQNEAQEIEPEMRRHLQRMVETALAYDAAIQAGPKSKSRIGDADSLDGLYDAWITAANEAQAFLRLF
jgi:hypothetical protein